MVFVTQNFWIIECKELFNLISDILHILWHIIYHTYVCVTIQSGCFEWGITITILSVAWPYAALPTVEGTGKLFVRQGSSTKYLWFGRKKISPSVYLLSTIPKADTFPINVFGQLRVYKFSICYLWDFSSFRMDMEIKKNALSPKDLFTVAKSPAKKSPSPQNPFRTYRYRCNFFTWTLFFIYFIF